MGRPFTATAAAWGPSRCSEGGADAPVSYMAALCGRFRMEGSNTPLPEGGQPTGRRPTRTLPYEQGLRQSLHVLLKSKTAIFSQKNLTPIDMYSSCTMIVHRLDGVGVCTHVFGMQCKISVQ